MPEEIVMPRLSDTMEEGTIARWLKHEGEPVHKGEAILEVETDKATMPLEAYSEGVIQQILQPEGATVPVGSVIGLLAKPGEVNIPKQAAPAMAKSARTGAEAAATMASSPVSPGTALLPASPAQNGGHDGSNGVGRVKASPLARNLARQNNVDLIALDGHGSGPGGRIVKLDVERYLSDHEPRAAREEAAPERRGAMATEEPGRAPAAVVAQDDDVELRKPNRIQQVMARRLTESKTTIPHFYVTNEVDMTAAADLRKQLVASLGDEGKVSYNDLVVRACALALRAMPDVNTSWQDGQFATHRHVNVGIAVTVPDGLLVPVIRDADRKSLRELAAEGRDLAARAREGKLSAREMEGGTFTVSNLGMFDIEEFQAIINPPESAILAVGAIVEKPVALDGQVVVRPRMKLTLSVDHRVIPGVPAAQFLQQLKRMLQEPLRLGF